MTPNETQSPLDAARKLAPMVRSCADETEAERELPRPLFEALAVPGGYRVTGRQGFSTGCRHAAWQASHAQVFENGQLRLLPDGQPETRYLFVPVAEAERLDTWQVRGMRGTGTHHFAVHDVFVP